MQRQQAPSITAEALKKRKTYKNKQKYSISYNSTDLPEKFTIKYKIFILYQGNKQCRSQLLKNKALKIKVMLAWLCSTQANSEWSIRSVVEWIERLLLKR